MRRGAGWETTRRMLGHFAKLAAAHGFPAVGLTDTGNLFGALEFSDKLADTGIQPIVGCTLRIDGGQSLWGDTWGSIDTPVAD